MQVFDASEKLHKRQSGVCFIVGAPLQDRIQQLAACEQLCDEVHLVALLKILLQKDHVLVVHAHQNVYLLEDVLPAAHHTSTPSAVTVTGMTMVMMSIVMMSIVMKLVQMMDMIITMIVMKLMQVMIVTMTMMIMIHVAMTLM